MNKKYTIPLYKSHGDKWSADWDGMHIIITFDGKIYPISNKFYEWLMQNPYPKGIVVS